jgi:uncharacterized membrane protein
VPTSTAPASSQADPEEQLGHLEVELVAAERLTFFSDAVVAIAITLLALELPVPLAKTNDGFLHEIGKDQQAYIAFLISFAVIAAHWYGHHRMFRYVTGLNGRVVRWNMLWLLMIILTPFATKVLTAEGAFQARFTFYAAVQALAGLFFLFAVRGLARNGLLREDTPPRAVANTYWRMSFLIAAFAVSIPTAFWTRWAYLCWVVMPFAARGAHQLADRWPRRGAPSAGRGL